MTRRERNHGDAYCSWGHHRNIRVTRYTNGTMCVDCEMEIAETVAARAEFPELSEAIRIKHRDNRIQKAARTEVSQRIGDGRGFIYYLRINDHIKIGYAKDVTARMRNYPPESELLAVEPGDLQTERDRHDEFHRYLRRGREWFEPGPLLETHIAHIRDICGDPTRLAYQYTKPARN